MTLQLIERLKVDNAQRKTKPYLLSINSKLLLGKIHTRKCKCCTFTHSQIKNADIYASHSEKEEQDKEDKCFSGKGNAKC